MDLHLSGYTTDGSPADVAVFRDGASSIDTTTGDGGSQTLPPYSITTVTLHPKSGTASALSAPDAPKVTSVTDTTATLSWSPSTGGIPVRYEVYPPAGHHQRAAHRHDLHDGDRAQPVPGCDVHARRAGQGRRRTTVTVLGPVTVRTTSPAESACGVSYRFIGGWGSGFNAEITVTDTGPNPIDGWTLAFSFPDSGVSVTGYWNAKVTQSGRNVVATPESYNGRLAADGGNSVSFGFTGANSGAYSPPTVFTLNGTVCTTA